jgi:hypothetical protein
MQAMVMTTMIGDDGDVCEWAADVNVWNVYFGLVGML